MSVSYTHLDVYKRQLINRPIKQDDVKEISAILKEDATLTSFNLSDREKYILKKYCLELSSFGEIGDSLKISPQRVRILYKKAFVKVKSSLSNLAIKEDKKATVKFKADKPTLENSLPMGLSEKKRRKNIIYIDDVMELKTQPRNILKANQINTLQN